MKILIVLAMLYISTPRLFAETVLHCQQPTQFGLYEQCEEIVLLEKSGLRVRAYSKPQQKVFLFDRREVFFAERLSNSAPINKTVKLGVPADLLWTNSKDGFQSLCQVKKELPSQLLLISCGRFENEKIAKESVFQLRPYFDARGIQESNLNPSQKMN